MIKKIFLSIVVVMALSITGFSQKVTESKNDEINSKEKIEFQNFFNEFKSAVLKKDSRKVKEMIKFPIICLKDGKESKKITKDEFEIGENKYFDKKLIDLLTATDKIRKKKIKNYYSIFTLTNDSIVYEINLAGWHFQYSSLLISKVNGKIMVVGEDSGTAQ